MHVLSPEDKQWLAEKVQELCPWVAEHERLIRESTSSLPLTPEQREDAKNVGVENVEQVRLLYAEVIPEPPELFLTGFSSKDPVLGLAARYGIYLTAADQGNREHVIHELVHTMQYERCGGIEEFLHAFLYESFFIPGYPSGLLEQEARNKAREMCA